MENRTHRKAKPSLISLKGFVRAYALPTKRERAIMDYAGDTIAEELKAGRDGSLYQYLVHRAQARQRAELSH